MEFPPTDWNTGTMKDDQSIANSALSHRRMTLAEISLITAGQFFCLNHTAEVYVRPAAIVVEFYFCRWDKRNLQRLKKFFPCSENPWLNQSYDCKDGCYDFIRCHYCLINRSFRHTDAPCKNINGIGHTFGISIIQNVANINSFRDGNPARKSTILQVPAILLCSSLF